MYRTNTEPADASPTAQFKPMEKPNESITRNNNFSRTPCSIWRARTPLSKRRIHQQHICGHSQIKPPKHCTSPSNGNGNRRTPAALWSRRIICDQLPHLSRRTHGCGGPGNCRSEIVGARSFRLVGTRLGNPPMALAGTRRANIAGNQSHGARTCRGNCASACATTAYRFAQFIFCRFKCFQFHIVWQRWSIALAAWSLVCPTLRFKHTRKDFATCQ